MTRSSPCTHQKAISRGLLSASHPSCSRVFSTMALSALARWTIAPELLLYVSALDSKNGSYAFQWVVREKNVRRRR